MTDTRYPYTYACDLIRTIVGYKNGSTVLSRSQASQIRSKIAEILEIDDEIVAKKLAGYYLENRETIEEKAAYQVIKQLTGE